MQETALTTDVLPALTLVPCILDFEDFQDVSYSPRLLLPVCLPSVIADDAEYTQGCEVGFDLFLEWSWVDEAPSLIGLKQHIVQELFPGPSDTASLAARFGAVHGFLSVLAFFDRALALQGLDILLHLTDHLVFLSAA